jgi:large subunit ribosomal protein L54
LPVIKKKDLPVETDVNKLVSYCCGLNIYKTGGEEVKLKDDSEYPEWLWKLNCNGAPPLEEMDPNTLQYWVRKRRMEIRYKNRLRKGRYPEPFIPKHVKSLRLA